jgi:hypothetical protein
VTSSAGDSMWVFALEEKEITQISWRKLIVLCSFSLRISAIFEVTRDDIVSISESVSIVKWPELQ